MNQKTADPGADFQTMAQQSLETWKNMWTQATGQVLDAAATHSAGGLGSSNKTGNEAVDRTLEGLKNYCSWMESMSAASAMAPGTVRWDQAFSRAFSDMSAQGFGQPFSGFADMGQLPDGQAWMQQLMQGMAPMQKSAEDLLGMPAFGLNREHQEQRQALVRAWLDYLEQTARYQQLVSAVGKRAAEHLQEQLSEHEEPGRQVDTLRGLYNLWVDAAEDAWAEVAMSDEYRQIYGAMVNAQMRVRSLVQQKVAESGSQLGMPTRSEVDTLGQRLQELRREIRASSTQTLTEELGQLREELAAMRGNQRRSAGRAVSAAKSASKRPAKKAPTKKVAAGKKAVAKAAPPRKAARKAPAKKAGKPSVAGKSRTRKKKGS